MHDSIQQLQTRFILHLVVALQSELGRGNMLLTRSFVPLDGILSAAEPDLREAKAELTKITEEWRQRRQESGAVDRAVACCAAYNRRGICP